VKSYRHSIEMHTEEREQVLDITERVQEVCARSGIADGFALVCSQHTSSAVYISDNDPALTEDLRRVLAQIVPEGTVYAHDLADPKGNGHAHIRATLVGLSCSVPVTNGALELGVYQTIYYAEFDGQRTKTVLIKVIGE